MAARIPVRTTGTLERFVSLSVDDHPYLSYLGTQSDAKGFLPTRYGILRYRFAESLNRFAEVKGIGFAVPEVRCTFAGRSIVPDVAFFLGFRVDHDADDEMADGTRLRPDLQVEIVSPRQPARLAVEKLEYSVADGCSLGWLVAPLEQTITVYRPGAEPERVGLDGVVEGDSVLPGYRLPVAKALGWMRFSPSKRTPSR